MIFAKFINNMYRLKASIIALLIVCAISSVTIRAGGASYQISQSELPNYLSTLIGVNHESIKMSAQLRKMASGLRVSLLNPIDQINFLLVVDDSIWNIQQKQRDLANQFNTILANAHDNIGISIVYSQSQAALEQQIQKYTNERSVLVIIRERSEELQILSEVIKSKDKASKRRLNQKQYKQQKQIHQQTADDAEFYLIKFFFSLLFIIVIIGIVSSIASNQGRKDTLLYARFIADVSNSR